MLQQQDLSHFPLGMKQGENTGENTESKSTGWNPQKSKEGRNMKLCVKYGIQTKAGIKEILGNFTAWNSDKRNIRRTLGRLLDCNGGRYWVDSFLMSSGCSMKDPNIT